MAERDTITQSAETNTIDGDAIERLCEIKDDIKQLIEEAMNLIPEPEHARARGYWYAHIRCALDKDHTFLGGSMRTMQDSIDALAEVDAGDDEGGER